MRTNALVDPQPHTHADRMALAEHIRNRAMQMRDDVIAVAIYGSVARGDDGPYSDLEMMVVLESEGVDYSHEWTAGPWKAEVNFLGRAVALAAAAELDGDWAMTKGQFAFALPLHDPQDLFSEYRRRVFAHTHDDMQECIRDLIVGEGYELVGKWRNMQVTNDYSFLPTCATKLAQFGAWSLGLAQGKLYSTSARMLHESLQLSNRPSGYDALCQSIMHGALHPPSTMMAVCEDFWRDWVMWAEGLEIVLVTDPMHLDAQTRDS